MPPNVANLVRSPSKFGAYCDASNENSKVWPPITATKVGFVKTADSLRACRQTTPSRAAQITSFACGQQHVDTESGDTGRR